MRTINKEAVTAIIGVLLRYPEGIWLRRLAKEASVPVSTVHFYLTGVLNNLTQSSGAKSSEGKYFGIRVIKLKQGVLKRLWEGESIEKLIAEARELSQHE